MVLARAEAALASSWFMHAHSSLFCSDRLSAACDRVTLWSSTTCIPLNLHHRHHWSLPDTCRRANSNGLSGIQPFHRGWSVSLLTDSVTNP